ncbi:MAG: hypothetical protein ACTHNU_16460 [Gaiellales bacterium]
MRPGDVAATIVRPAISGTMRARQTKKERQRVTLQQWIGFILVAAATTWLTKTLDDLVERQFSAGDA